jgi:hypothetical protein
MAQNSTCNDLRLDKNRIGISCPSGWKAIEDNDKNNIVFFLAPSANSSDVHPAAIGIYKQNLSASKVLANKSNITENTLFTVYSQALITYLNDSHFNITKIKMTKFLGSPAYWIDFKIDGKVISYVWNMKNYNVYGIMFVTNKNNYPNYLSQFNKMKESFKIADQ